MHFVREGVTIGLKLIKMQSERPTLMNNMFLKVCLHVTIITTIKGSIVPMVTVRIMHRMGNWPFSTHYSDNNKNILWN